MRRALTKMKNELIGQHAGLSGDCSGLSGNCSRLSGNCSRLSGDCTWLSGNFDDCEISADDRKNGVDIFDLIVTAGVSETPVF